MPNYNALQFSSKQQNNEMVADTEVGTLVNLPLFCLNCHCTNLLGCKYHMWSSICVQACGITNQGLSTIPWHHSFLSVHKIQTSSLTTAWCEWVSWHFLQLSSCNPRWPTSATYCSSETNPCDNLKTPSSIQRLRADIVRTGSHALDTLLQAAY